MRETENREEATVEAPLQPFSLYRELTIKIKKALTCGTKNSPAARICLSFDIIQFNGGLKAVGVPSKIIGGIQYYRISHYHDLNPLLGRNWHFRGLNTNGDYGYVVMATVEFYVHKNKQLLEYYPDISDDGSLSQSTFDTGYSLTFCFVCAYGTMTTFGKDKGVFYDK